jgi:hypothetical protein
MVVSAVVDSDGRGDGVRRPEIVDGATVVLVEGGETVPFAFLWADRVASVEDDGGHVVSGESDDEVREATLPSIFERVAPRDRGSDGDDGSNGTVLTDHLFDFGQLFGATR